MLAAAVPIELRRASTVDQILVCNVSPTRQWTVLAIAKGDAMQMCALLHFTHDMSYEWRQPRAHGSRYSMIRWNGQLPGTDVDRSATTVSADVRGGGLTAVDAFAWSR